MDCYATLFVNWFIKDNGHFEHLLERRLKPEVGLQHGGFDLSASQHRETAAIIRDHGLGCAIHLPFYGVSTGDPDPRRWRRSQDLLLRALEIAAWYEPDHLIGHPDFVPATDARAGAIDLPDERWLEQSARAWGEVLAASPARLYLENTMDQSPAALLALLERLPERAALCFDVGHWFSAAGGARKRNLREWLDQIAGRLGHLHLHDNDGRDDQHLGIGRGGIDFGEFLDELDRRRLRPTFTLEAHTVAQLDSSLAWLGALPPESPLAR